MNPNVGKMVNGWTLLDRATFERVVVDVIIESARSGAQNNNSPGNYEGYDRARDVTATSIDLSGRTDFPGLNTSGDCWVAAPGFDWEPWSTIINYIDVGGGDTGSLVPVISINYQAAADAIASWLRQPGRVFVFDGEQAPDRPRDRIRVAYIRYGDVMVCVKVAPYYKGSDWVDIRGGLIFVASVAFAASYAALSAEAAAAASGVPVNSTALSVQGLSQVVSGYAGMAGDSNLAAVGKVLGAASGQFGDTATPGINSLDAGASGSGTMGFFDDTFEGFNFSSGEADVAFSDAQNVSYGFDDWGQWTPEMDSYVMTDDYFGGDVYDFGGGTGGYDFNATPEVVTNDFGTLFDHQFGMGDVNTAVQGVKIAQQIGGTTQQAQTGQKASSGSTGAKSTATGGADVLGGFSQFLSTVANTAKQVSGVAAQVTTVAPKTYTGQLQPGGAAGGSSITHMLLIGGLVALGAVIYFARKKG